MLWKSQTYLNLRTDATSQVGQKYPTDTKYISVIYAFIKLIDMFLEVFKVEVIMELVSNLPLAINHSYNIHNIVLFLLFEEVMINW